MKLVGLVTFIFIWVVMAFLAELALSSINIPISGVSIVMAWGVIASMIAGAISDRTEKWIKGE